jgi:hypothetical protein
MNHQLNSVLLEGKAVVTDVAGGLGCEFALTNKHHDKTLTIPCYVSGDLATKARARLPADVRVVGWLEGSDVGIVMYVEHIEFRNT